MRILHTADWHVGKKLGRIDRATETEAVLDELIAITKDQDIDLVIVSGDLFDRSIPPFNSLRLVLQTLVRLADTGAHVVAVPGNHDSAELFHVLAPHLAHSRVHLAAKALRPEEGGVVVIPSRDQATRAQVALFPFLHEAAVVEWMDDPDDKNKAYADKVRAICSAYGQAMLKTAAKDTIDVLVGHFMVHGAIPSGSERELHIGEAYMARAEAIPNVHYAALGHIHKAQAAPGSEDFARYCGSLMQLDFGEAGQEKSVVVADVTPAGRRRIEAIPITAGRRLVAVRDTLKGLTKRTNELSGAILKVDVITEGPSPGIADEVRSILGEDVLYVRADYPRSELETAAREGLGLVELYAQYVQHHHGAPAEEELLTAFKDLQDEVNVSL